jgi:anaerobic magnesium-protoporphyrin IX monomethyl ester cyclase
MGKTRTKPIRVLLIEASAEMEMGIPPNVAILVSAVKAAGFDVDVFSTNEYKHGSTTGDEVRVNTLQVPPSLLSEVSIRPKGSDMVSDFQEKVRKYEPDIIGLSTTEPTYKAGLELLRSIKDNGILTIVGGAYPTLCPEFIIKEDAVDSVCIGEGENALVELCQSMQSNKSFYDIKNMWFKKDSEIVKNPPRALCEIDDIPFQDWTPWQVPPRASKAMAGEIRTTALVELTRGCPFSCNFCANHFLNQNFKGNYRERSVGRFIEEIQHLQTKFNVAFIYIADETFLTTSQKRFKEFIDRYSQVKLPFWCQSRPESITYEKIKALKEVGLHAINIGIESGNFEFRKKILNRASTDSKIINGITEATRAGVRVGANVIIGFPGETREHIFETIELVRQANPSSTMIHLFQPYIKTPLRQECVKMGLIEEDHICGDYRMEAIGSGILSATELLGIQRTFNLYVDLPKDRWDQIRVAESFDTEGNKKYKCLAKEFQLKHFGRTSIGDM